MPMTELRTIFFLGKGGTGKSTASVLLSLELMEKGKKVVLASFDDAHNLSDIFEREFSHKPSSITPSLKVIQVDRDREIKRYLKETTQKVKKSYTYLTAFNLDNYFDVLKYSPGMETHAMATAFLALKEKYKTHDYLIVDMPPTALSMHFFNLPSLSLLWVAQLEKLRKDINQRKEIVSRIKFAGKQIERDKVLARIQEIKSEHQVLKGFFEDPALSLFFAVLNPDRLSQAETRRIIEQLDPLNIELNGLIFNHRTPDKAVTDNPDWASIPALNLPYSPGSLIGQSVLAQYRASHGIDFSASLDLGL